MKKIIYLFTALAVLIPLILSGGAANADTTSARQQWHDYAVQEIQAADSEDSLPDCPLGTDSGSASEGCNLVNELAFSYGLKARAYGWEYGWNDSRTQNELSLLLAEKKTSSTNPVGGYGENFRRDAFGDGTTNNTDVIYTVEDTDHAGETILAAAEAGALPGSEVDYVVNSIMHQPIKHSAYGDCMAYSSSPNDVDYCVINVSLGAAAFLKETMDAGYPATYIPSTYADGTATGYTSEQDVIDGLGDYGVYAYTHPSETGAKAGWWPYLRDENAHTWAGTGTGGDPEQDWNHNAYTAESAQTLGLTDSNGVNIGLDSLQKMQDLPNYWQNAKTQEGLITQQRAVEGRLRVESDLPDYKPENMWQDEQTYERDTESKPLGYRVQTDYLQAALWASRLASNANANSVVERTTTFMSTPKAYDYKTGDLISGTTVTVPVGTMVTLKGDVRAGDSTSGWIWIATKDVKFKRHDGTLIDTKPTGMVGNIQFVWTADKNRCFYFQTDDFTSNEKCINVN